jgi:hypothetical protein
MSGFLFPLNHLAARLSREECEDHVAWEHMKNTGGENLRSPPDTLIHFKDNKAEAIVVFISFVLFNKPFSRSKSESYIQQERGVRRRLDFEKPENTR